MGPINPPNSYDREKKFKQKLTLSSIAKLIKPQLKINKYKCLAYIKIKINHQKLKNCAINQSQERERERERERDK